MTLLSIISIYTECSVGPPSYTPPNKTQRGDYTAMRVTDRNTLPLHSQLIDLFVLEEIYDKKFIIIK